MRAVARRLRQLEQRYGPVVESYESQERRARLVAARLRCGLPPVCTKRRGELRGMSIIEILNSGRQRVAVTSHRRAEIIAPVID